MMFPRDEGTLEKIGPWKHSIWESIMVQKLARKGADSSEITESCFIGWSNSHFNNLHFRISLSQRRRQQRDLHLDGAQVAGAEGAPAHLLDRHEVGLSFVCLLLFVCFIMYFVCFHSCFHKEGLSSPRPNLRG